LLFSIDSFCFYRLIQRLVFQPPRIGLYKQTLGAYFEANILYNHCEDILVGLLGANARHPLLLRTAFSASSNFRGPGYYEDSAVKLNVAFTMASELYDADSVPVAKAIYSRALLMRDLGDLTEASRLLPQVSSHAHINPSHIYPFHIPPTSIPLTGHPS
jgi:hypothetical protein